MPEGHTIHRLARQVDARLVGQVVTASSPQGRFAAGASRLDGGRVKRVDAHGKHLFVDVAGQWLHVHLGLFGKVSFTSPPATPPTGAVRLRLLTDEHVLDLRGPTVCEVVTDEEKRALHSRLGADPLRRDADPEAAFAKLRRRRISVAAALLDQSLVAGIGNVYRAELLHRAAVAPHREARAVTHSDWVGLWDDTVRQMRAGVRSGRIVTTDREHRDRPSGRARRSDAHYVYGRGGLPCRRCGTLVRTETIGARAVSWCPTCQNM